MSQFHVMAVTNTAGAGTDEEEKEEEVIYLTQHSKHRKRAGLPENPKVNKAGHPNTNY